MTLIHVATFIFADSFVTYVVSWPFRHSFHQRKQTSSVSMEKSLTLQTADGASIAAQLFLAPQSAGGALVLHPNPSRRGDMENPVVSEICCALQAANWSTLRFNMRSHVEPLEQLALNGHDARAALHAAQQHFATPLVVVGYSWGGLVATRLVTETVAHADALAVISPAFNLLPSGVSYAALSSWQRPLLLLAGGADDFCPAEALQKASVGSEDATQRTIIEGVDHFWSRNAASKAGLSVAAWAAKLPRSSARASPGIGLPTGNEHPTDGPETGGACDA